MLLYAVFNRENKSCNSEILGVYTSKEIAICYLMKYLTDHNPVDCNTTGCNECLEYNDILASYKNGKNCEDGFEIIEMELDKCWY